MRFYDKPRRRPTIIVVTMIDVFCVLLIFFIVATTFRKNVTPTVKISLPEATTGTTSGSPDPIVLTVTPDEKIFLNAQPMSLEQLRKYLQDAGHKDPRPVIAMQADKKASFGLIIRIMDEAKAAGYDQLPAFIDQPGKP